MKIYVNKLSQNAYLPTRGSEEAAGLDLYSAYNYLIPAKDNALIATDLQICLPKETYGRIAPRSGLALHHFLDIGGGVIDRDYRGNLCVIIFNFGKKPFRIEKGDRIAQLIVEKIYLPSVCETTQLDTTRRGAKGFGSTDLN